MTKPMYPPFNKNHFNNGSKKFAIKDLYKQARSPIVFALQKIGYQDHQYTEKEDFIVGSTKRDSIQGLGGDDFIYAGPSNDIIYGDYQRGRSNFEQGGNDTIFAGSGNDYAYGNKGDDHIYGEVGNDVLYGGGPLGHLGNGLDPSSRDINGRLLNPLFSGHDVLDGGKGRDTLIGGDGQDLFYVYDHDRQYDVVEDLRDEGDQIVFKNGQLDAPRFEIIQQTNKQYLKIFDGDQLVCRVHGVSRVSNNDHHDTYGTRLEFNRDGIEVVGRNGTGEVDIIMA